MWGHRQAGAGKASSLPVNASCTKQAFTHVWAGKKNPKFYGGGQGIKGEKKERYIGLIKLVKRFVKIWQVCMGFNLFLPTSVKEDLQKAQKKTTSKCLVKTRSSICSSPLHPFQHELILLWHWTKETQTEIPSVLAACLSYSVCKLSLRTRLEWKWIEWRQFMATISDSFITNQSWQLSLLTYIGCIHNTWHTHRENGQ